MKVEFEFGIDETVETPFGDRGIVTMLAVDDSGKVYYVKTANNSQWFKEKELERR